MTRLFGVIGSPIAHSLSPAMHSAALKALKIDAVYSAFEVPPGRLRPILRALVLAGVEGLNVTVPLKERVIALIDGLDPAAKAIGAVNTLVIRNRKITGYNTDASGFLKALKEMSGRVEAGHAVVLGAGGAARAVVWALSGIRGMRLTLANRHLLKAKQLARQARHWHKGAGAIKATTLDKVQLKGADWLINATTVGMRPGKPPVGLKALQRATRVYDLVYHRETELVKAARRRGCVASGGLSMLLYQGAQSLELWTRRKVPIEIMRAALKRAI